MRKHRSYPIEFKRQVAQEYLVAARLVAHGSPPNPGSWLAENDSTLAGDRMAPGLRTKGPATQLHEKSSRICNE